MVSATPAASDYTTATPAAASSLESPPVSAAAALAPIVPTATGGIAGVVVEEDERPRRPELEPRRAATSRDARDGRFETAESEDMARVTIDVQI